MNVCASVWYSLVMSEIKSEKDRWCASSKIYRGSKKQDGFVAMNKYVPKELRTPLHAFINEQIELFMSGGATKLDNYSEKPLNRSR